MDKTIKDFIEIIESSHTANVDYSKLDIFDIVDKIDEPNPVQMYNYLQGLERRDIISDLTKATTRITFYFQGVNKSRQECKVTVDEKQVLLANKGQYTLVKAPRFVLTIDGMTYNETEFFTRHLRVIYNRINKNFEDNGYVLNDNSGLEDYKLYLSYEKNNNAFRVKLEDGRIHLNSDAPNFVVSNSFTLSELDKFFTTIDLLLPLEEVVKDNTSSLNSLIKYLTSNPREMPEDMEHRYTVKLPMDTNEYKKYAREFFYDYINTGEILNCNNKYLIDGEEFSAIELDVKYLYHNQQSNSFTVLDVTEIVLRKEDGELYTIDNIKERYLDLFGNELGFLLKSKGLKLEGVPSYYENRFNVTAREGANRTGIREISVMNNQGRVFHIKVSLEQGYYELTFPRERKRDIIDFIKNL